MITAVMIQLYLI